MDRHTESRLKRELVIWLVTSGRNGQPQAVPVWFLWDRDSFTVHSQDGIKVRHIKENPLVELHLNSDEVGGELVRVSGTASISQAPPAHKNPVYMRKYARQIRDLGMTPESFSTGYPNVISVRRLRYH